MVPRYPRKIFIGDVKGKHIEKYNHYKVEMKTYPVMNRCRDKITPNQV